MIQIYYHVVKVLKYCFSHNAGTQRNQVRYSDSKGQFLAWMTCLWLSLEFDGGTGSIRTGCLPDFLVLYLPSISKGIL